MHCHIGFLFVFSPLCISKEVLKLLAWDDTSTVTFVSYNPFHGHDHLAESPNEMLTTK